MSRVVVVGGGFGGTAAAARLAKLGHQVTVVERRDRLGGAVGFVEQDGFRWDAGPTSTALPAVLRDLFRKSGRPLERELELVPVEPMREHRFEDGSSVRDAVGQPRRPARGGHRGAGRRRRAAVGRLRARLRRPVGPAATRLPRAPLLPRARRQGHRVTAAHEGDPAQGRHQDVQGRAAASAGLLPLPDGRPRPPQRPVVDGDVVLRRAELRHVDGAGRHGRARGPDDQAARRARRRRC